MVCPASMSNFDLSHTPRKTRSPLARRAFEDLQLDELWAEFWRLDWGGSVDGSGRVCRDGATTAHHPQPCTLSRPALTPRLPEIYKAPPEISRRGRHDSTPDLQTRGLHRFASTASNSKFLKFHQRRKAEWF